MRWAPPHLFGLLDERHRRDLRHADPVLPHARGRLVEVGDQLLHPLPRDLDVAVGRFGDPALAIVATEDVLAARLLLEERRRRGDEEPSRSQLLDLVDEDLAHGLVGYVRVRIEVPEEVVDDLGPGCCHAYTPLSSTLGCTTILQLSIALGLAFSVGCGYFRPRTWPPPFSSVLDLEPLIAV